MKLAKHIRRGFKRFSSIDYVFLRELDILISKGLGMESHRPGGITWVGEGYDERKANSETGRKG